MVRFASNMDQLYDTALQVMDQAFSALSRKVGSPSRESMGNGYVYRYKEQSIYQAIVQKIARILTGLQAIRLLNKAGLLQEQAALQRMLDEFREDIAFLCFAIIFDELSDVHEEYLKAFYEEEFDDPESAIRSNQKRPMISRKKIRAFLSKDRGTGYDPSTTNEVSRTLSKIYSGYVHGASPQIMEMYFGNPPQFHLFGSNDSPLFDDHTGDLLNYFHRSIHSFALVAKAFGDETLFDEIREFADKFAVVSGREDQLREIRKT